MENKRDGGGRRGEKTSRARDKWELYRDLFARSSHSPFNLFLSHGIAVDYIVLIEFRECGYFEWKGGGGGGGLEVTRAGVGKNGVSAPPVHQSGIN